jgi:dipeptide/tripeptide permease
MYNFIYAFVLKNQNKFGYSLIALSIAIAAISYIKPIIDEPGIAEGRKQLLQAVLVFM